TTRHCLVPGRRADSTGPAPPPAPAASPELARAAATVRTCAVIMNERRGRKLPEPWMTAAIATGEPAPGTFVTGLPADHDAVTAGLSLPWTSGAVEGRIDRIKMPNDKCTPAPAPTCSPSAASSPAS